MAPKEEKFKFGSKIGRSKHFGHYNFDEH
jgi:hypothetical protein